MTMTIKAAFIALTLSFLVKAQTTTSMDFAMPTGSGDVMALPGVQNPFNDWPTVPGQGMCFGANRKAPVNPLAHECLQTFDGVRGNGGLVWDNSLASLCQGGADYCANTAQRHLPQYIPSDGGQILFITELQCGGSAIQGWYFDEAPSNGPHYQIIRDQNYRKVGCAVARTGSGCICCNFQV